MKTAYFRALDPSQASFLHYFSYNILITVGTSIGTALKSYYISE